VAVCAPLGGETNKGKRMNALILQDPSARSIVFPDSAKDAREDALEACALVGAVRNADENEKAQAAMAMNDEFLSKMESARVEAKKPALEECRLIDRKVAEFVSDAKAEQLRVRKMQGDWLTHEEAIRRDAEVARLRDIEALERQKRQEMARSENHEAREAIQARYEGMQATMPMPPPPPRAQGQSIRPKLNIEITNIDALNAAYPHCVRKEPKMLELQAVINSLPEGTTIPGVTFERVIASGTVGRRKQGVLEIGGGG